MSGLQSSRHGGSHRGQRCALESLDRDGFGNDFGHALLQPNDVMLQALEASGVVVGMHAVCSFEGDNGLAVTDEPCPQNAAQTAFVEAMPTDRLVIRICQASGPSARPDQDDATPVSVVVMWFQCEHGLAEVIGEEKRFRSVRVPRHSEIERYDLLSHGRQSSPDTHASDVVGTGPVSTTWTRDRRVRARPSRLPPFTNTGSAEASGALSHLLSGWANAIPAPADKHLICRCPSGTCDHHVVESHREPDGRISLVMSEAEAVVLHQVISISEWSNELDAIELREPVERKILSEVQQTLAPLIPGLGTDTYQRTVETAYSDIESSPF